MPASSRIFATSDLHVGHTDNRMLVEAIGGDHLSDVLLVAGDVGERVEDIEWTLRRLREVFGTVVWAPGNHELWTSPRSVDLRGEARYRHLVEMCRSVDVRTPEDPYEVWDGPGGPLAIAPLFLLYDYSYRPDGVSRSDALAAAWAAGVVCTDEFVLHPDPHPTREAWCGVRVAATAERLAAVPAELRTVLVTHWPLHRGPTLVLRHPEFSLWCGTTATADWHVRFRAELAVYGHLHIPRTTSYDGVRFEEVSLGYPREWRRRPTPPIVLRQVLPA